MFVSLLVLPFILCSTNHPIFRGKIYFHLLHLAKVYLGTDGEVFDLGLDTNDVLREWLHAKDEVKKYESLKSLRSLLKHLAGLNDGPLML